MVTLKIILHILKIFKKKIASYFLQKQLKSCFLNGEIYIIKYYSKREIKKLLESDERLVYVDDNEVVIRYQDIPDFIVDYNKFNLRNLKIFEYDPPSMEPLLTTYNEYLNKCDPNVRKDIIERLTYLQLGGKIKKYKVIDEKDLEIVKEELEIKI